MSMSWKEITIDQQMHVEKAFKLYDESFPIVVREPHEILFNSLHYANQHTRNNFRFLVGLEGENLVSLVTAHYLADVNAGFIVYLATDPKIRNKGLGTKTLRKMENLLNEDAVFVGFAGLNAISLETEKYELLHKKEEKEDSIKRTHFFKKNEYQLYDEVHYVQPPLHDEGESVPLNLFIKTAQKGVCTKEEIKRIITAMYREKYDAVNGIDPKVLTGCFKEMFE